jgi:hypothetical protein
MIDASIADDQRQKSLNRCGDSSVHRTVCWMFLCPGFQGKTMKSI